LRYHVEPISPEGFSRLLTLENTEIPVIDPQWKLTRDDLQQIQTQSAQVLLDDDVQYLLSQLREHLTTQNIYVSDRRWRKLVKLLKVAAWIDGRTTVDVWDCWLLQHCLWHSPEQCKSMGSDSIDFRKFAMLPPVNYLRGVCRWHGYPVFLFRINPHFFDPFFL
jgi:MoxR-like ATPase